MGEGLFLLHHTSAEISSQLQEREIQQVLKRTVSQAVLAVVRRSMIVQHIQNIRTLYIKNHVHRMFLNNYCSQSRTMCPVLILGSLHSYFSSCPRWDSPPYCLHTTYSLYKHVYSYGSHISICAYSVASTSIILKQRATKTIFCSALLSLSSPLPQYSSRDCWGE